MPFTYYERTTIAQLILSVSIAIIAAALILKSEKISLIPFRKNKQQKTEADSEAGKNSLRMP